MKILFVHNKYQQAGGEDVAVELEAALLQEKGHEVRTILFQNTIPAGSIAKLNEGRKSIFNTNSLEIVKSAIKEFKPDLVHVHNLFFHASPSVLYACKEMKVPVVMTLHNFRLLCANAMFLRNGKPCELCRNKNFPIFPIRYRCYRKSSSQSALVLSITGLHKTLGTWKKKVDKFIVLTEFSKSRFLNSSLEVPAERLVVKSNFVPDPGENHIDREDFFLFVGRLSAEKNAETVLKAFSSGMGGKIILIGDGPDREKLEKQFLGKGNITFAGALDRNMVLDHMKRCKALIFASTWYEGLPFTIIEAFASGTPVIASRLGSMVELIEDGYNGLHFEVGDMEDLKVKIEQLERLIEAGDRRIYSNARKTYLDRFHPEVHYQSIYSIYQSVIAENSLDV